MARTMVTFKWNRKGYNALKASDGMRALLLDRAQAMADAASGASGCSYVASAKKARIANLGSLAVVATWDRRAMEDNAANNTLAKSIDAGRF